MDRTGREARLALLTQHQAGVFTFGQALDLGFPRATISRRLARGVWQRRAPGVLAISGAGAGRDTELWSAVLAVGHHAVVTHESAALLHGAEGLPASPVTLTNPHRWHHRLPGIFVHQIDDLVPAHRTSVRGLPVSTAARAVVELGATQAREVVERIVIGSGRLRMRL